MTTVERAIASGVVTFEVHTTASGLQIEGEVETGTSREHFSGWLALLSVIQALATSQAAPSQL
jgi:hypothetical protein